MRKPNGEPFDLDYVFDRSMPEPNSGCWIWMKAETKNGYGALRINKRSARPHRLAFECATGKKLSSNIDVCHKCDVRLCVNPSHLFAGTRADNMRDCSDKGRIVVPALKGEACPASKLSADQVRQIRNDPRSQRQLAAIYGVDKGTIAGIKNWKTWRSIV